LKPHFQNRFRILIVSVCFLFISISAYSQKGPPLPPIGPPPPVGLPIDGGLSYLLIAGAAYGVYKLKKKQ
jgi:hypothetical protein